MSASRFGVFPAVVRRAVFFLFAVLALTPVQFHYYWNPTGIHSGQLDFQPTIIAARLYNGGKKSAIYGPGDAVAKAWLAEKRRLSNGAFPTFFAYLPGYLAPFIVLERMAEYETIIDVFFQLNFFVVALVLTISVMRAGLGFRMSVLSIALLGGSYTVGTVLALGQNIAICVLFLWLYTGFMMQRRYGGAALFLLLAVLCKPWAAAFVLLPVLRWDVKGSVIMSASLAASLLLQYLWEPNLFREALAFFQYLSAAQWPTFNNLSLMGTQAKLANLLSTQSNAGLVRIISFALAGAILLMGQIASRARMKVVSLLTAVFLVISVFWDHYFILFLPILGPFVSRLWKRHRLQFLLFALCFVLVFLLGHFGVSVYVDAFIIPNYGKGVAEVLHFVFQSIGLVLIIHLYVHEWSRNAWRRDLSRFPQRLKSLNWP